MQYYMEYTLGWRGSSNKKADKGTIVHKALEICAVAKKGLQESKRETDVKIAGLDEDQRKMYDLLQKEEDEE